MDGGNEIQGYMWGGMRHKDTCESGNEIQVYMLLGEMRYKVTCWEDVIQGYK